MEFNILKNKKEQLVNIEEKDINKTLRYILKDDNMFEDFFKHGLNIKFYDIDYDVLKDIIFKIESKGLKYSLSFINFIPLDKQINLLNEDFSDDTILKMFSFLKTEAISNFFVNNIRGRELYKMIYIPRFLEKGVKFSDEIVKSKDFFEALKSSSFVEFRTNINNAEKYNNPTFIEERLKKYYDELISDYNSKKKVFNKYLIVLEEDKLFSKEIMDDFFIDSSISYELLEMIKENPADHELILEILRNITSVKLSEIIVDAIFRDNYYNICLNINEMLRYNNKLSENEKVLNKYKIYFYKIILNFDNIDSNKKIDIYNKLKDKNYSLIFYEDLRKLKDISYNKIKNDTLKIYNCSEQKDEINSKKYGVDIYDLRNSKYTMLVRKINKFNDKTRVIRNCYSLISNENTEIFDSEYDGFLYGYNTFENDKVLHILETDSNSVPSKDDSSMFVNRIMTSEEIVKSNNWYSEIQILNDKNDDCYDAIVPDYLVVFDNINDRFIKEAKRLSIPIVVITKKELKNQTNIVLDRENDIYVNDVCNEELRKKHR